MLFHNDAQLVVIFMQQSFIGVAKSAMSLHTAYIVRLTTAEIMSHVTLTAWYVLCSFRKAAQGAVQNAHSVPDTRVPAFDPALGSKRKRYQTNTG